MTDFFLRIWDKSVYPAEKAMKSLSCSLVYHADLSSVLFFMLDMTSLFDCSHRHRLQSYHSLLCVPMPELLRTQPMQPSERQNASWIRVKRLFIYSLRSIMHNNKGQLWLISKCQLAKHLLARENMAFPGTWAHLGTCCEQLVIS